MLSLPSCIYKNVEIVKLENAAVKKFSSKGIEAEVFLKVKNPNGYNISIINSDLDVFVNDKAVGKAKVTDKIMFPKKSEEVHRVHFESDFEKLGGGVLTTLASVVMSQTIHLGVKGEITVKAGFLKKKLKVDIKENVNYTQK